MLVKCTKFYPYFGFYYLRIPIIPVKIGQSRDKILYILLAFVFNPAMVVDMYS